MKYKVGDRVKDTEFGEGIVVEIETGTIQTSILVQFDNENKKLHDGNGLSKEKHEKNKCCFYSQDTRLLKLIKSKQFTKSDLKDGDIVTYQNGNQRTLKGDILVDKEGFRVGNLKSYDSNLKNLNVQGNNIIKVERPTGYETVFKRKEDILNEAEKKYLSGVIRPFRNEVRGIIKEKLNDKNWISIDFKNDACMDFPNLKKKDDYKGMEVGKLYSLEELGL